MPFVELLQRFTPLTYHWVNLKGKYGFNSFQTFNSSLMCQSVNLYFHSIFVSFSCSLDYFFYIFRLVCNIWLGIYHGIMFLLEPLKNLYVSYLIHTALVVYFGVLAICFLAVERFFR